MKIVYNIYVAVRKLWNAIFGKNGDGSEIKLVKANPSGDGEALNKIEINGVVYSIIKGTAGVTSVNGESGDVFVASDGSLANDWDETVEYKAGILLSYQGKLYECIKDATAGTLPTNTTYFKEVSVAEKIGDLQTGLENGTIVPNKSRATESIENVSDESGTTQDNPFISQGTGTNNNVDSVDTSPVAKQLQKNGNTVAKNQYSEDITSGSESVSTDYQPVKSFTSTNDIIPVGHKILLCGWLKSTNGTNVWLSYSDSNLTHGGVVATTSTAFEFKTGIYTVDSTYTGRRLRIFGMSGDTVYWNKVCLFDLTQWFGGNDKIPQDLLSNPSHFSWYYNGSLAYDAGSLKNANGRYLVCTGRNLFDGTNDFFVVPGRPLYCKGTATITYKDAGGNTIGTESVTNGTFTPPTNCFICGASGSGSITISLYYSAEQGGEGYDQYYPYQEPSVYDTGTEELLAFDKKLPSGVVERNTSEYTFTGSETWSYADEASPFFYFTLSDTSAKSQRCTASNGIVINRYANSNVVRAYLTYNPQITSSSNMNTVMPSGTKMQFELADAYKTTEQGTSFAENIEIDDYGMMYWLDTDGNLVDIPQGVKVFYPADYVLWLDTAVSTTNGDATDIALKSEITDTALAERGYNKTSDLYGYFGSKETAGGILRHLLVTNVVAGGGTLDFADTDWVDLGEQTWTYNSTYSCFTSGVISGGATSFKLLCSKYKTVSNYLSLGNKTIAYIYNNCIAIQDTTYGTDATAFKNAMKGILCAYEKAST